jgi:hypothetical protein
MELSASTSTVHGVNPDDAVDPGDAALQALLAAIAEGTHDSQRRDRLLDMMLTIAPLREWTTESLARLHDVATFGAGLGRQL